MRNQWKFVGIIAISALTVLTVITGFQNTAEKFGVVDLNKVIQQSELGKANTQALNTALSSRKGLLDFINTYQVLTAEQAQSLRELTLKTNITDAEKQQMEKIKSDVKASEAKFKEINQKAQLTDADRTLLQDFNTRIQGMARTLERWNQEFTDEVAQLQQQLQSSTIDKAKAAVQQVAKAQGYSLVFESTVAPFGANDLTEAAVKAMNANK